MGVFARFPAPLGLAGRASAGEFGGKDLVGRDWRLDLRGSGM